MEVKTGWIVPTEMQKKDVPRELHAKAKEIYEAYLREHRPVLVENLGDNRKHEPTNFPPGVKTLFPGFWPVSRDTTFVNATFYKALGCGERELRGLMEKAYTPGLREYQVHEVAVGQAFGHTKKVGDQSYKYGLKNTINVRFPVLNQIKPPAPRGPSVNSFKFQPCDYTQRL